MTEKKLSRRSIFLFYLIQCEILGPTYSTFLNHKTQLDTTNEHKKTPYLNNEYTTILLRIFLSLEFGPRLHKSFYIKIREKNQLDPRTYYGEHLVVHRTFSSLNWIPTLVDWSLTIFNELVAGALRKTGITPPKNISNNAHI